MATSVNITIKNLPQIRAAFRKAPRLMARNTNKAIRNSIVTIERSSRIFTPVDTGTLRASHRALFSPLRGELSTNVFYDIFVHEGTRYMRARPYMRRSVEKHERDVDRFFGKAVQDTLNDIGRRT